MATPPGPGETTTPVPSSPSGTPTPPPSSSSSIPSSSSSTPTSSSSALTSASSSVPSTSSTPPSTSSSSPTTSSTPVTSNTPPTTTPSKVTTTQGPTTNVGGGVVTRFTTSFESNTSSIGASSTAVASSGKSFFKNTGAVAGTFSVVGLIVAALIIALITNGIRRRRARKFDRELAEATMEAASAPKPIFLDDEDDVGGGYGARGGYGAGGMGGGGGGGAGEYSDYAGGGQFSDVSSHGTYGQPPMSVAGSGQESYGMREMGHGGGVGPGEIFDPYSVAGVGATAGAAGIGVARARSQKAQVEGVGYGAALQEGGAPYAAFAAPQGGGYDPYANNPGGYQRNADILEAAGMGVHAGGAGALARGPSMNYATGTQYQGQQLHHRTSPSQEYPNLGRSKSSGGMAPVQEREPPVSATSGTSGATQYFSPVAESYASHYQAQGPAPPLAQGQPQPLAQAYHQPQHQPQPQPQQGHQRGYSTTSGDGDDMDDAYGGYVADMHAGYDAPSSGAGGKGQSAVPNPFVASDGQLRQESGSDAESRYSDEEVEEEPRRVLKVANE